MQRSSFLARSFSAFTRGVLAASLILLLLSFLEKADAKPVYPNVEMAVRANAFESVISDSRGDNQLRKLYRVNGYRPIWHGNTRATQRRLDLITALQRIGIDGLDQHQYLLPLFADRLETIDIERDIATSRVFLRLIADLAGGQTSPSELGIEWDINRDQLDPVKLATTVLTATDLVAAMESVRPAHKHYQTLRAAFRRYQTLAENGGWRPLPDNTLIKPGMMSSLVSKLRQRLAVEKSSRQLTNTAVPEMYDAELEAAVIAFQRRHGLDPDGVVGHRTVEVLNVPVEQRLRQIALNLERWRWLPRELGARHILVNTAEFRLALYEHDRPSLNMRVVVGKTERQTPIVSKDLKYLVLNPTWTVPARILYKDIMPKLQEQPDYLQTKGIRVFAGWDADSALLNEDEIDWSRVSEQHSPYKVQQAPGAKNALGQIKFMFPNQHSVYIHDTPSRGLFAERTRAFSSGCVRVEHPLELARALLGDNERWQGDKLQSTLDAGETTSVILKESVPVHLVYLTAWVDETGELQFRNDIYKRDARLQLALLRGKQINS